MNILNNIFTVDFWISLLYILPGLLIGLCFHEFAHAFAAHCVGDDTAKNLGRLTVNPLAHLDPVGTVCMLFFGFGWAKPVPVNSRNYKGNKKLADIIVSLAGITMNFLIAVICIFLCYFLVYVVKVNNTVILDILVTAASLNLCLMVFNLIPIPPLDGSHIVENMLPLKARMSFNSFKPYSVLVLVIVISVLNITGIIGTVMNWLFSLINSFFMWVFSGYIV